MARRGRDINTFNDLKGDSVGIGPEGSGTAYLMQQLLRNTDLSALDLKPSTHALEAQAQLVRDGGLDLAAFVMNENAEMIRTLTNKYDLEIVAPSDMEGLASRDKWLRVWSYPRRLLRRRQTDSRDRQAGRAGRYAGHDQRMRASGGAGRLPDAAQRGVPQFRSSEPASLGEVAGHGALADEAREFFASGQPAIADKSSPGS